MAIQITQELETNLGIKLPGAYGRLDIRFGLNGWIEVMPLWYTDKAAYTSGKDTINRLLTAHSGSTRFHDVTKEEMSLNGAHDKYLEMITSSSINSASIVDLD
tara:strand:+ start:3186 stop:3494 length:309 start_codon:yes stop_codon:yes gene_type:complete